LFVLNDEGRITSNREPSLSPGPLFSLVRSLTGCAWAVRVDVPDDVARELDVVAREEPPASSLRDAPVHADRYLSLLEGAFRSGRAVAAEIRQSAGPALTFPDGVTQSGDIAVIEDERPLERNFRGWVAGEIAAGCAPVMAIIRDGYPVSICFSARRSDVAAEAGVETAEPFRGQGFGSRVTAAWALAIRASGRVPLYSTSWTNAASLAVARKLGLIPYASNWTLSTRRQGDYGASGRCASKS
jgi:RimJ/RimL family protein N-acetyltransferase